MIGYLLIVRHLGRCVKGTLHGFVRELLTETTCAGQAGLLELSHNRRSQYGTCCCHRKLTRRIWEKTTNLPLSFLLESFLSERCTCHQEGPWIRLWAKQDDWPETTQKSTHYHKTEITSHVAEQFSWVPLPCCSPPWCPFSIKSLALCVSTENSFLSARQEATLGSGRGPPSCNSFTHQETHTLLREVWFTAYIPVILNYL